MTAFSEFCEFSYEIIKTEGSFSKLLTLQLVSEVGAVLQTVLPQTFHRQIIHPSPRVGMVTKCTS